MRFLWLMTVAAIAAGYAAGAGAQTAPQDALDGLDPVLLVQGKEVAGKPDLTVVRGRFEYSFSSPETRAAFERTPERFEIQMNGACARMGPMAGGNPSDYLVHDGKIYIFGSDECHKRFAATPAKFLPPTTPAMPTEAAALAGGRALVDRAVIAIGGARSLDSLSSCVESWSATQPTMQGDIPVTARALWRFPDAVRLERTMTRDNKTTTTARVVAGGEAWFDGGPGRIFPMQPDTVGELQRTFAWRVIPMLRARTASDFQAVSLGKATMAGAMVERVRVRQGPVDATLGIDPSSGEVRAVSFVGRNAEGQFGEYEIALSDYRAVGVLKLPFSERALFDGVADSGMSRTLSAIDLNVPLDAALFARAAGSAR
jgi:YHS domain-containing protein